MGCHQKGVRTGIHGVVSRLEKEVKKGSLETWGKKDIHGVVA